MRRILLLFHLFLFSAVSAMAQTAAAKDSIAMRYASTITPGELSRHLHIIAADSMEGREAGAPGQKKAAAYIRQEFIRSGLRPGVKNDSGADYFQKFDLVRKEWDSVYIRLNGAQKVFLKDFYAYGDLKLPEEQKLQMVFGGYGIDAPAYSDYKYVDVKGKGVILFTGEPVVNGKSLVTGTTSLSDWSSDWRKKTATALAKGAKAVFMIVGTTDTEFKTRQSLVKHHIEQPTLGFTYKQAPGSAFFLPISLAAEMLNTNPEELLKRKEMTACKKKYKLKSADVIAKVGVKETTIGTENILGLIEGTDRKDEFIVITAHYDHIGMEGDSIYNGADDDGSGTVALLEIGEAFALAKQKGHGPRRSVLIMPVTAEEKGLLGSEYYTDNPVFPLKNTVANLNVDMIGRIDEAHQGNPDYEYTIGSNRLSTDLHKIGEKANDLYTKLQLDYTYNTKDDPNRFYYRSDHYNFAKNNIPVIFYFNGTHEDYHQPSDSVEKINFNKIAKIGQLIFYTAWELANREERIKVDVHE